MPDVDGYGTAGNVTAVDEEQAVREWQSEMAGAASRYINTIEVIMCPDYLGLLSR